MNKLDKHFAYLLGGVGWYFAATVIPAIADWQVAGVSVALVGLIDWLYAQK